MYCLDNFMMSASLWWHLGGFGQKESVQVECEPCHLKCGKTHKNLEECRADVR